MATDARENVDERRRITCEMSPRATREVMNKVDELPRCTMHESRSSRCHVIASPGCVSTYTPVVLFVISRGSRVSF